MTAERTFHWGAVLFGSVAAIGLATLPYASRCCSRFSAEDLALRKAIEWEPPGPAITNALMGWPLGFRLILLIIVGAIICAVAMTILASVAYREQRVEPTTSDRRWIALRAVMSSMIVGVLYLVAIYTTGFFGVSRGPHNLVWMLGIPAAIGWMNHPKLRGVAFGAPLALTGFVCLIIISLSLQIPLD